MRHITEEMEDYKAANMAKGKRGFVIIGKSILIAFALLSLVTFGVAQYFRAELNDSVTDCR